MNRQNRGIITGMVLGNAQIIKARNLRGTLKITHDNENLVYLEHKESLLHHMLGNKIHKRKFTEDGRDYTEISQSDSYYRILRKWSYRSDIKSVLKKPHIIKFISPPGLALWWMDCGSVQDDTGVAYTEFTPEENQLIADAFLEKFEVQFILEDDHLTIDEENLRKFVPMIEKWIIPSMKHKVELSIDETQVVLSEEDATFEEDAPFEEHTQTALLEGETFENDLIVALPEENENFEEVVSIKEKPNFRPLNERVSS